VPEQVPDRYEIGAFIEQVRGETVSQGMGRQSLRTCDHIQDPANDTLDLSAGQPAAVRGLEQRVICGPS